MLHLVTLVLRLRLLPEPHLGTDLDAIQIRLDSLGAVLPWGDPDTVVGGLETAVVYRVFDFLGGGSQARQNDGERRKANAAK